MEHAFICDGLRTPIGSYGGALSGLRTDDLGALPLQALMARHPRLDWEQLDEVVYGCVNQAGEDNRNVARMSSLLAGLPVTVAAATVNRLCGSGLEAVAAAARGIATGQLGLAVAGGVDQRQLREDREAVAGPLHQGTRHQPRFPPHRRDESCRRSPHLRHRFHEQPPVHHLCRW